MPETDRRPAPTLWMFLLVLLGLYTIPGRTSNAPAPASSKPESKRPDSGSSGAWDAGERGSVDRVLLDYFSLGRRGEVSGSPNAPSGPRTIDQVLGKGFPLETVPPPPIRCLIATLADPVHTTSGYHFDEGLTAILRGIEAKHYVLDRYRLPAPKPGRPGLLICRCYEGDDQKDQQGPAAKAPRCCWSSSCPSRRPRASTRARWPRASTGPRRSTITGEPSTRSGPQPIARSTSWARPSPARRRRSN